MKFDNTVHAGHILTALTVLTCATGTWYDMRARVDTVQQNYIAQQRQLDTAADAYEKLDTKWQARLDVVTNMQRNELVKMRDDMNTWFVRLNDKLDTKADKH